MIGVETVIVSLFLPSRLIPDVLGPLESRTSYIEHLTGFHHHRHLSKCRDTCCASATACQDG